MKYERMVEIIDNIKTHKAQIFSLEPLINGFWKADFSTQYGGSNVIILEGGSPTALYSKANELIANFAKSEIARLQAEIQELESLTE